MKILLTGATGFTGVHLVDRLLEDDWDIFSLQRGAVPSHPRIQVLYHDFRAEIPNWMLKRLEGVTHIIHLGAEVHGLRSLADPELFVHANVLGTFNVLEASRKLPTARFIYVSSAEALGGVDAFSSLTESAPLNPSNPYAAGKAGGEMLVQSYARSFGVPAIIVRTMNLFGEKQKVGKFVPDTVRKMLLGETVVMHVDATGKSGSRQWLHVGEFVSALRFLLLNGDVGEIYHVVGEEKNNVEIVDEIGLALKTPWRIRSEIPGKAHNMRYSIVDSKLPPEAYSRDTFENDMQRTIQWYKQNPQAVGL